MNKEKERLVEDIGLYFEKAYSFSPLMARIYTLLILCPHSGYSFDDIVEYTQSSKSSVSTNLNLLLEKGGVEYFTKPGDRKRYFRSSRDYLKVNLVDYFEKTKKGLEVANKIYDYNQKYNKLKYSKGKKVARLYKEFLERNLKNLECTINQMNQLEETV